ncbi:uncharacterized protein LOC111705903 [Eurytemora carolleeae]|uniref:uncharacterized protein LOC111705903 n=1 Tax=Eurytemora carolleeae TaxID=1294199 RepID=UPI000C75BCBA|nr:uncharacterized protein LOC111705903 [Eurytemora carolleeae]|eukprot:XP_023334374.1 uncharacterized protein LOC111705903 [Eurytemora affinis]
MHPRIKVPSAYKKEFPGAADFYKNFVEPRLPVIFENAAGGLEADQLKLSNLNNSGLAALSFIEVSRFVEEEKDRRSLREFSKHIHEEIYLQDNVNNNIKKFITLPRCLRCSYLTPHLVETRHVVIGRSFPLPLIQDENDLLTCLLDGKKEVILADPREYPEITRILDLDQSSGEKGSFINSLRVDYLKYPEAAKVGKYRVALLGPGDCLYIPAAWIQQTNIIETVNTIELRWENTAWKPDDECLKSIHKHAPLSQFSYKGRKIFIINSIVYNLGFQWK